MEIHERRMDRTALGQIWGEGNRSVSQESPTLSLSLQEGERLVGLLSQPSFRLSPSRREAEQAVGRAESRL